MAELVGVTQKTVSNMIDASKNGQLSIFTKDFQPLLYNMWHTPKQDNASGPRGRGADFGTHGFHTGQ